MVESDESIRGESSPLNCRGPKQSGSKPNFANSEQFNQLERSALNTIVPGKVSSGEYLLFPSREIENINVVYQYQYPYISIKYHHNLVSQSGTISKFLANLSRKFKNYFLYWFPPQKMRICLLGLILRGLNGKNEEN